MPATKTTPARKRGRPKGSKNKKPAEAAKILKRLVVKTPRKARKTTANGTTNGAARKSRKGMYHKEGLRNAQVRILSVLEPLGRGETMPKLLICKEAKVDPAWFGPNVGLANP